MDDLKKVAGQMGDIVADAAQDMHAVVTDAAGDMMQAVKVAMPGADDADAGVEVSVPTEGEATPAAEGTEVPMAEDAHEDKVTG